MIDLAAERAKRKGCERTREDLLAMAAIWENAAVSLEDMFENSQMERSQAFRLRLEAAKLA